MIRIVAAEFRAQDIAIARHILEPDLPLRHASSYLHLRRGVLVLEAPGGLCIDVDTFLAAVRRQLTAAAVAVIECDYEPTTHV